MKRNLWTACLVFLMTAGLMISCGDSSTSDCVKLCVKTMECTGFDMGGYTKDACEEVCKQEPGAYAEEAACCLEIADCTDFMSCYNSGGCGDSPDDENDDENDDEDEEAGEE